LAFFPKITRVVVVVVRVVVVVLVVLVVVVVVVVLVLVVVVVVLVVVVLVVVVVVVVLVVVVVVVVLVVVVLVVVRVVVVVVVVLVVVVEVVVLVVVVVVEDLVVVVVLVTGATVDTRVVIVVSRDITKTLFSSTVPLFSMRGMQPKRTPALTSTIVKNKKLAFESDDCVLVISNLKNKTEKKLKNFNV
jgi:hypothetical protein